MAAIPSLKEKRVLVTGAASGIGLECAKAFARQGARLIVTDINEAALASARDQVLASGAPECIACVCDVADEVSVSSCAQRVAHEGWVLDVLVNNAGIYYLGGFMETALETWQRMLDINVLGIVRMTRAFLPAMQATDGPRQIVNIGSLASFLGAPNIAAYVASKHAVLGISDVLMMELMAKRSPVGVTLVCPGIINTPLLGSKGVGSNITERQIRRQQVYYREHGCLPDVVANGVVKAVQRGDRYCFVGPNAKLGIFVSRISRTLTRWLTLRGAPDVGYLDSAA